LHTLLCLFNKLRSKRASLQFFLFLFLTQDLKPILTLLFLVFYSSLNFVRVETAGRLVTVMLLFLYTHKVLFRYENVRTLFLLIVEFFDQLVISLVKIFFILRVLPGWIKFLHT
jgi:hypothetical protein